MTGSELRGDEPGVYPVVFWGVKIMGLLEHLDETGVKDVDAMLIRLEAEYALQVTSEMARVTAGRFETKANVRQLVFLHKRHDPLLQIQHTGLIIGDGKAIERLGDVAFWEAADHVVLTAYIDPDK